MFQKNMLLPSSSFSFIDAGIGPIVQSGCNEAGRRDTNWGGKEAETDLSQ